HVASLLVHAFVPHACLLVRKHRLPCSPLFPYTTLFRSHRADRPVLQGSAGDGRRPLGHIGPARPPRKVIRPKAPGRSSGRRRNRSEEHTSELQSRENLVCRLLLEKKNKRRYHYVSSSSA